MTRKSRLTPASVLCAALLATSGCSDPTAPTEQPDVATASSVDATPLAVKLVLDEFAAAEAAFARAAAFHRDSPTSSGDNELRNHAYALLHRAEIAKAWHGDWARATDLVDQADATFAMMPFSRGRWSAALERVEIAIAAETFDLAGDRLTTAWEVGVELAAERPITDGEYLYARARLATELEQYGDAIDLAREALMIFRTAGSVTDQARLFTLLARIEASRGESAAAIAMLDHALELYAALEARDDLVRARSELARLLARAGHVALAEELMRAAAEVGAVYAYRTELEYQLANAVVLAHAGDLAGAASWLTAARELAEGQPAGDPLGLRRVSEAQTEVAALTISTEPPRVSARAAALATSSLATSSISHTRTVTTVPAQTFRLSPQVASVTIADDATARYRWTVTNISERALSLQLWLNDTSSRLWLETVDRNTRARERGDQLIEIALAPGEKRAVFVELPPVAVSTSIALLHARDRVGGYQASAAFEVHRDDGDSITNIAGAAISDTGVSIGGGVAWDPTLHGVEFFHELRSRDLPEIERVTLTVTASARCYLEIRDGSGRLIAIDADGDGRLDGRGDSVYSDLDRDGRADLAIVRDAETTPFLVVAYPTDGDVELTVSVTAEGTVIASGRDVILRR